tara:strand:+ start:99 stop:293 length:195 start_codon:yes stop_codon:yes gene_type:complete
MHRRSTPDNSRCPNYTTETSDRSIAAKLLWAPSHTELYEILKDNWIHGMLKGDEIDFNATVRET